MTGARCAAAAFIATFAQIAMADVQVSGVWSRATPPGATVGVVYAQLVATQTDELIGITTAIASRVDLHSSVVEGGTMRMRTVGTVPLPAGQSVKLESGGLHAMLMGLKQPLQGGTTFEVTLRFRHSAPATVVAKVIAPGAPAPMP